MQMHNSESVIVICNYNNAKQNINENHKTDKTFSLFIFDEKKTSAALSTWPRLHFFIATYIQTLLHDSGNIAA